MEDFHRDRSSRDGRAGRCKCCANASTKAWVERNRERRAAAAAAWAARLKAEVIAAYGGCCACCGETEPDFLTLDHVDGVVPPEHRYADGSRINGPALYGRVKREGFPPAYRVLCWNCNAARGLYGLCPHERKLRAVS